MMRTTIAMGFSALLFTACTALGLGSQDGAVKGKGAAGSAECDRTGSGLSCAADTDCAADEECDDGVCKLHESACDGAGSGDDDGSGDDHGGHHGDDDGAGSDDHGTDPSTGTGVAGDACTADSECGSGLECEHSVCAPHGGN